MQEPIVIDKTLNIQDVDTSIQSISMNATEEVFEKFGWRGKTEDILKNDQQKFLKGFV